MSSKLRWGHTLLRTNMLGTCWPLYVSRIVQSTPTEGGSIKDNLQSDQVANQKRSFDLKGEVTSDSNGEVVTVRFSSLERRLHRFENQKHWKGQDCLDDETVFDPPPSKTSGSRRDVTDYDKNELLVINSTYLRDKTFQTKTSQFLWTNLWQ